jgi:class 3 adenylate cyclase
VLQRFSGSGAGFRGTDTTAAPDRVTMPSARVMADDDIEKAMASARKGGKNNEAAVPEWPFKVKTRKFMKTSTVELTSMALTLYALFAKDILLAASDGAYARGDDDVLGYITFVVALLFTLETGLNSWTDKQYHLGLFMWLDVIATVSLYSEVPFIAQALFGGTGTVARAGRAARVGTRVGRILRLVRLIRVLRVLKFVKNTKERRHKKRVATEKQQQEERVRQVIEARKKEAMAEAAATRQSVNSPTLNISSITERIDGAAEEDSEAGSHALSTMEPRNAVLNRLNEIDEMEKEFEANLSADDMEDASSLANRMSNMMTIKVVIGVLFMMLVLPLIGTDAPALEGEGIRLEDGLYMLDASRAGRPNGNCTESAAQSFKSLYTSSGGVIDILQLSCGGQTVIGKNHEVLAKLRPEEHQHACAARYKGDCARDPLPLDTTFAILNVRSYKKDEARSNIYVTLFVIMMLVFGATSITADSNRLAVQITEPLKQLSHDMESIAMLDLTPSFLEKEPDTSSVGIREMELAQHAFFRMKTGVGSFAKYAPMAVVKNMMRAGKVAVLGVKRKPISILFSDIAKFTTICETMRPAELLEMLSDYFQAMSEIITRTDGILAEFIGDAILALWTCPQDVKMHGQQSVEAAVQMQESVDASQRRWASKGYPEVAIRVGVHTADVFVGNLGSAERMKYGVLGDGVNLASRLEELNKRYTTRVLVSNDTHKEPGVASSYITRPVDLVVVKGKKLPTKVHEVMGRLGNDDTGAAGKPGRVMDASPSPCAMSSRFYLNNELNHTKGYAAINRAAQLQKDAFVSYMDRDFGKSKDLFKQASSLLLTDKAAPVLIERCEQLALNPPSPEWDGSEVLKDKTFDDARDKGTAGKANMDETMKRKVSISYVETAKEASEAMDI